MLALLNTRQFLIKNSLILLSILFILPAEKSKAGLFEIGMSGSYRRSNLDENNFTETKSLTGSVSYYFMAMSALEFSYTKGLSTIETDPSSVAGSTTKTEYQLLGADLILSYGTRESAFRPYIKFGAVHMKRKIIIQNSFASDTIEPDDGIAPSAGLGIKILINKQLSIKLGYDMWTSPLGQDPITYNYSGRLGISWLM